MSYHKDATIQLLLIDNGVTNHYWINKIFQNIRSMVLQGPKINDKTSLHVALANAYMEMKALSKSTDAIHKNEHDH